MPFWSDPNFARFVLIPPFCRNFVCTPSMAQRLHRYAVGRQNMIMVAAKGGEYICMPSG